MQENCPLNYSLIVIEENNEMNLSTISEIVNLENSPHPNIENADMVHPSETHNANLGWKTPDGMHCSYDDIFPAQNNTGPLHRVAVANRYRLDYTASPAHNKAVPDEIESSANRSFLDKCTPGQSNL